MAEAVAFLVNIEKNKFEKYIIFGTQNGALYPLLNIYDS